jgi:serine protease
VEYRKSRLRLLALMGLALAPCAGQAAATASPESYDRLIVRWRAAPLDSLAESRGALRLGERNGQRVLRSRQIGGRLSVLQLDHEESGAQLDATLAALRADPDIDMVEPDRRVHAHAYTPNDPLFANQWYLKGTTAAGIRADTAWETTRGGASPATSTVVVAVLDTGVRFDHPDLRPSSAGGKLLAGYDFVSADKAGVFDTANDGNGWDPDPSDPGDFLTSTELAGPTFRNKGCEVSDSSWHGTRTSGMIAADTDNGVGMAGAAFNIRVLPVRVLGKCGGYDSDVIAGMYWAAGMTVPATYLKDPLPTNPNPAQVINMSLGGIGACTSAYSTAVADITAHGVLIVVSSGNDGEAVASPANCIGALGVAGIRHIGTKVGYSNLGSEVGIAAPAGNCVNITPGSPCLFSLDTTSNDGISAPGNAIYTNQFNSNLGTSFASPQVAGAAGLMKAVNPALTPAALVARMKASARTFPTTSDTVPAPPVCQSPLVNPVQASECICTTAVCGAGMLDAGAAVIAALRPVALAQVVPAAGPTVTLDGSQSGASVGRTLVGYAWTVVTVSGGASTPIIQNANQAMASVTSPSTGSVLLRLTITDNLGATDSVDVTVTSSGGSSTNPPPGTNPGGGGGGGTAPGLLLVIALLYLARADRRWT